MKYMVLILCGIFAAPSAMSANVAKLEAMVVTDIRQSGNLMPGPRRRPTVRSTLSIEVQSSGCTGADDFDVTVDRAGDYQELTVVRQKPDNCKGVLRRETFDIETTELAASFRKGIRVMNPQLVTERFVH